MNAAGAEQPKSRTPVDPEHLTLDAAEQLFREHSRELLAAKRTVEAAEADSGLAIEVLRVDGGMSANPTFVQAVADAAQRVVEISPVTEATTLGAGFLAGLATGLWEGMDDVAAAWRPRATVEPGPALDRQRWAEAVERASGWIPDLSALDF